MYYIRMTESDGSVWFMITLRQDHWQFVANQDRATRLRKGEAEQWLTKLNRNQTRFTDPQDRCEYEIVKESF